MANANKSVYISVKGPAYGGAPYPPFSKKSINESKFEYECRFKEYSVEIRDGKGYVEWLSQDADDPTEAWETEIKRAFEANGLKSGDEILVKYGSRDTGCIHEFTITL